MEDPIQLWIIESYKTSKDLNSTSQRFTMVTNKPLTMLYKRKTEIKINNVKFYWHSISST